ncbi:MAG: ATP-binding cassette domain-containing protein [Acidimicrobiia bacterium]
MLSLEGCSLRRGTNLVLDDVSATFEPGLTALIGPSGIGKSTFLRAIAGLLPLGHGTITLDGHDLTEVPAERRGFGVVLQDPTLFPNLNVADNVSFGLRVRRQQRQVRDTAASALLEEVGLAGFGTRTVATLSGGEAHRVALARALAVKPRVLLLDEPLGGLDPELRAGIAALIAAATAERGTITIWIEHDQPLALAVAQRVLTMGIGGQLAPGE